MRTVPFVDVFLIYLRSDEFRILLFHHLDSSPLLFLDVGIYQYKFPSYNSFRRNTWVLMCFNFSFKIFLDLTFNFFFDPSIVAEHVVVFVVVFNIFIRV